MKTQSPIDQLPEGKAPMVNGNGKKAASSLSVAAPNKPVVRQPQAPHFDRPVVLQQSPRWSRLIIWTILIITGAVTAWAFLYRIEEAIPAVGQLEPKGAVKEVKAPVDGVVKELLVKDGDRVTKGQVLVRLDPKAALTDIASNKRIRQELMVQNKFYKQILAGIDNADIPASLPPEVATKIRNRRELLAENQLYRTQLSGSASGLSLSSEQRDRLESGLAQGRSSVEAAAARVAELRDNRTQANSRLQQNRIQLANAEKALALEQGILKELQPVFEQGALAGLQFKRQQATVQESQSEVDRLREQQVELVAGIAAVDKEIFSAKQQLTVQKASNRTGLHDRIADNSKRIGQINSELGTIDGELKRRIVENDKQVAEIDNRLAQAQLTVRYQELRSPVDGTVFDLKPTSSGYVIKPNDTQPVLKIVPADSLQAKIYISNKDIGFVKKNMESEVSAAGRAQEFKNKCENKALPVDVRIDSFPFSEFGDVKGCLFKIGSDALPPDQTTGRNFFSFPADILLKSQSLNPDDQPPLPLQSGMSINVNIKLRKRPVISIFTEHFFRQADNAKHFR